MSSLKLGDWIEEIPGTPGYDPEVGDVGSAEILGTTYPTVIMPDGREWISQNLKYSALGVWFNGAGSDNGFGRYYLRSEATSIDALLSNGWHIPTRSEWQVLVNAAGGTGAGNAFAVSGTLPNWNRDTGTNTTGFSAVASGYREFGTWDGYAGNPGAFANPPTLRFWLGDFEPNGNHRYGNVDESQTVPYAKALGYGTLNTFGSKVLSVRLVRDVAPIPPTPPSYISGAHDLLVLPNGRAETTDSLAQRIDIRLRTFIGEHWLNPELGVPWFEEFLRKAPDLRLCRQILVAVLQDVPGVVTVESLDVVLDKVSRQMRVSFTVSGTDTIPQSGITAVPL